MRRLSCGRSAQASLVLMSAALISCGSEPSDDCVSNDECAEGLVCVRGVCSDGCNQTRDCGFGELCVGNECVEDVVIDDDEGGFIWQTSAFGPCSNTCGDGERTRAVRCIDLSDSSVADETSCPEPKPSEVESCRVSTACAWVTSDWSECSVTCGNEPGIEARTVRCENADGRAVDDALCENNEQAPAAMRACNATTACSWLTSDWSPCSVSCGDGIEIRTVSCVDAANDVVPETYCSAAAEPTDSRACSETCDWVVGAYGDCSVECGTGTRSRSVECRNSSLALVNEASCPAPKPDAETSCSEACAWSTGPWGPCSATCVFEAGQRVRVVDCRNDQGEVVSDSGCGTPVPVDTQNCSGSEPAVAWNTNCGTCDVSECTRQCIANCPDVENGCCDPSARPPEIQPCEPGACDCLEPPCIIP